jgi:pimeloyl-ACP methyl ester carboxylesterase
MFHVTSVDGTRIAFWRSGTGPPLLLIHGAIASHATTWRLVLPKLEERFTVCAMDRRGRGESGDAAAYDLQREAEDIRAVIDAIGRPTHVLGHSYGGLCALEAALLTADVRRLVLYEAIPLRGAYSYSPEIIERLETLIAAGQVEASLITMLREVAQLPPEEIELLRTQADAWSTRVANTRTMPRELRAEYNYLFTPARFARMRVPTLLLAGEDSPSRELTNARAVAAALPDARVKVLPGQQHIAMHTAPDTFVREVVEFLAE